MEIPTHRQRGNFRPESNSMFKCTLILMEYYYIILNGDRKFMYVSVYVCGRVCMCTYDVCNV